MGSRGRDLRSAALLMWKDSVDRIYGAKGSVGQRYSDVRAKWSILSIIELGEAGVEPS